MDRLHRVQAGTWLHQLLLRGQVQHLQDNK
jgi:hypothetical protein